MEYISLTFKFVSHIWRLIKRSEHLFLRTRNSVLWHQLLDSDETNTALVFCCPRVCLKIKSTYYVIIIEKKKKYWKKFLVGRKGQLLWTMFSFNTCNTVREARVNWSSSWNGQLHGIGIAMVLSIVVAHAGDFREFIPDGKWVFSILKIKLHHNSIPHMALFLMTSFISNQCQTFKNVRKIPKGYISDEKNAFWKTNCTWWWINCMCNVALEEKITNMRYDSNIWNLGDIKVN